MKEKNIYKIIVHLKNSGISHTKYTLNLKNNKYYNTRKRKYKNPLLVLWTLETLINPNTENPNT